MHDVVFTKWLQGLHARIVDLDMAPDTFNPDDPALKQVPQPAPLAPSNMRTTGQSIFWSEWYQGCVCPWSRVVWTQ